jgi:hypothetical protein
MSQKRRCKATITNDKRGREGQPCKLWARPNSDYCNRHTEAGGAGPRDVESMERRCIGRHSDGEQCKNAPLRGQRTCRYHGANQASAEKAQELLDRMVEPVLWELRAIALDPKTSESDRLRAIQMVLDRSIPRERKVEVSMKPWEVTMQHVFASPTDVGIARGVPEDMLATLDDSQRRALEQSYVDADVIEDEEDELERHERDEAEKRRIAREAEARDRARADLPQISDRREAQRVGSAEPPQRHSMRSPWG